MKRKTINIDPNVYVKVKDFCQKNALILSRLIEKIILDYLEQNKVKK